MPRPRFRAPLRQSSGQPQTARSLSALGIELHGLVSYPEALALAQARSFLHLQPDLGQAADGFRPGLAHRKGLTQKKSVPCWRDRGFDFENLGAEPYGNLTGVHLES